MIIAHIIGGLGNQMFQYAAARALALRKGVPLKLDISAFASYGLHQGFELARVFNCAGGIARAEDMRKMLGWQTSPRVRSLLSRYNLAALRPRKLAMEPSFSYWVGIDEVPDDCYLMGYWQSEKYFFDAAKRIREEFTFRQPLNKKSVEVASLISQVNAVSLHVRRGDYANDARTAATHGLCSLDYYHEAIRHIAGHVPNAHFFVFSDDISWVMENMQLELPFHYVDHNRGAESFNDMRLMSMCNHHVIANSSFSWWGAWLNPQTDKIVIAPKRWFANTTNTQDLIPSSWVRL